MKVIICGVGQVGSHATKVLASADNDITVIDTDSDRLRTIADTLDVATFCGNCVDAEVLREAGASQADLVVAVTSGDEVNMLAATIAKAVGAAKSIARVHHGAFISQRGFDYQQHLSIDRLICPEFSTAHVIASKLRNPAAMAIESFGPI